MSSERIEQDRSKIIEFPPRRGEPRRSQRPGGGKFRRLPHVLLFGVLLLLGFFVIRPASLALKQRMDSLRDQFLDWGEGLIGRRIEYESLGLSLLGGLDIRSLKITGEGPEPLVSADRLYVSWSLWDLLRGKAGVLTIRSLRLDRPRFSFDYRLDRDLLDLAARFEGGGQGLISGPLSVRIRDGGFKLAGLGNLEGLDLDAEIRGDWLEAQGLWNLSIAFAGLEPGDLGEGPWKERLPSGIPALNLAAGARFRLSCDLGFTGGRASLSVPSVEADRFRAGALNFDMEFRDRVFYLSNAPPGERSRAPLILNLDYGLDTGDFSLRLSCRDYSPGDSLALRGPWEEAYGPLLALRSSGEALLRSSGGVLEYRADLSGRIPPGLPLNGSGFRVKGEGNRERVYFDRLELALTRGPRGDKPGGTLAFQGGLELAALVPRGILSVRDFSLTGEEGLSAVLFVEGREKSIRVTGETLSAGEAVFHNLELDLRRETGGLSFNAGFRRLYGEGEGAWISEVQADGTYDYSPRHLETRLTLDSFSAGDFLEIAGPLVQTAELRDRLPPALLAGLEGFLDHTQVTTEIFATTDFDQILYNAPRLVISHSGGPELIALFSLSGTDRHLVLDGGQFLWEGGSGQITGQSDFSDRDHVSFAFTLGYRDLNYSLEGTILDRASLELRGSYGINGFFMAEAGAYSGSAGGENIPIPLGDGIARLDFQSSLRYLSSGDWSLDFGKLELADIPALNRESLGIPGLLRIAGNANQDRILLRELYYEDSLGALRGAGIFSLTGDGAGIRRGNFYAYDEAAGESCEADFALSSGQGIRLGDLFGSAFPLADFVLPSLGQLDLRLSGAGLRLARFSAEIPATQVTGDLGLVWRSPQDFEARLDIDSFKTGTGWREIRGSGRAFLSNGEFRCEDLRLKMGGLESLAPLFRLSLNESRIEGGGRIWGKLSEGAISLDFSLNSQFAPIASWGDYKTALEDLRGAVRLGDIMIDGRDAGKIYSFNFSRVGEGMIFSGGPEDMIYFNIQKGGNFIAAFGDPLPLRGSFQGVLSLSSIDARADNLSLDLGALWNFLPLKRDFNIARGSAVGSLQIRGPLSDPEFYGSVRGENLIMQVPQFLPEDIVPLRMDLVFDGNEMRFTDVSASSGRGTALVSGQFWLEKWLPGSFTLDILSAGDRPLPFSFDVGGILARGTVSGTMNLAMEDTILRISGDLLAQETEISVDAAELTTHQGGNNWGDASVLVNLDITAGRKVEFLWPTREFPMIRAHADLGARTNLRLNSIDQSFNFTGDVKLRGGEIFYFERSFYIRSGVLTFREDQSQFDPRITVRAEVRDRSSSGPVTISLVVDSAPLMSFTPRFESSPALSQVEIMSLLGQTFVGSTGEDGSVANPFLASSTDLLAQSQVMRRIQGALRDFLHLDMFSVRTQFIQRAAFSIMGLQAQPVDRIGWVGNYFDNTSVFVGKYIGSDMFAQLMLSMRYDEKKRTFGGYTFEPDFGIELQSPLGNIQWNLVPSHPENWYIDDCSFTISWNFTF
jgi:hypothetical protein